MQSRETKTGWIDERRGGGLEGRKRDLTSKGVLKKTSVRKAEEERKRESLGGEAGGRSEYFNVCARCHLPCTFSAARTTERFVVRPTPRSPAHFRNKRTLSLYRKRYPLLRSDAHGAGLQRQPIQATFLTQQGWPLERGGSRACTEEWHLGTRSLAALMRVGYLQPLPCATLLALGAARP